MSYMNTENESQTMGPAEMTRQVKALWKANEEIREDMKGFRAEQVEQGKVLTKIDGNIDRLASAVLLVPPRERCVEYGMRLKAVEEVVSDLEDKKQCDGCKNDPAVKSLTEDNKDQESRLQWLEKKMYMAIGALVALNFAVGVYLKFSGKG